ncbi:MAG: peptidoglycan-binding domain-containing protein [Pseudomonadota bacterium]
MMVSQMVRIGNQHRDDDLDFDDIDMEHEMPLWMSVCRANPGTTAATVITVTTFMVFAVNALFLQSQRHPSAWFETRATQNPSQLYPDEQRATPTAAENKDITRILIDPQTTALIGPPNSRPENYVQYVQMPEPQGPSAPQEAPTDLTANVTAQIQQLLANMGHYEGTVDGLDGPMTRAAIEAYKQTAGLTGVTMSDEQMLNNIRRSAAVLAAIPKQAEPPFELPKPKLRAQETAPEAIAQRVGPAGIDQDVKRVQAGLRAFGNSAIEVDGVFGSQTRASIREFQALFELPVTGEIDPQLVDKMVAIGLID